MVVQNVPPVNSESFSRKLNAGLKSSPGQPFYLFTPAVPILIPDPPRIRKNKAVKTLNKELEFFFLVFRG